MEWRNENYLRGLVHQFEGGKSSRALARELGVPFSTLKDYIARVQRKEPLPPVRDYPPAVEAVIVGGMSIRKAAVLYNIPKSTLYDYVKKEKNRLINQ